MIKLDNVALYRGGQCLFEKASFALHANEKLGLVGSNGTGKSSLFALLRGELAADEGNLECQLRIAHMGQEVSVSHRSAVDYVLDGNTQLRQIQSALLDAENTGDNHSIAKYHSQLEEIDGYTATNRAERLLHGLGFTPEQWHKPVNEFSGGWRIRLNLAQALMCPSELLLLDEPTNHLDLDAILWLEDWLKQYPGILLIISHDRDFLDNITTRIAYISQQTVHCYSGNYSGFETQHAAKLSQQQAMYDKQQQQIAHMEQFIRRFKAKATKAKQAQSRVKALERLEKIGPAHIDSPFEFTIPEPEKLSTPLIKLDHCSYGYGSGENATTILNPFSIIIAPGSRVGLLGHNGAGKSTLIKGLAQLLKPASGDVIEGEHLKIGYFAQHQLEALDDQASALLHVQRMSPKVSEQVIRNFLGGFGFHGDQATVPITPFSGGEKARLALALIIWQRPNLLLLDEPTNHLDLEMRHALTMALQTFTGAMIIVSHDRSLLRNTVDDFLLVHNHEVASFDGDLDDYYRWTQEDKKKSDSSSDIEDPAKANSLDKKALRQQAAARRQKLQPLTKKIRQLEQSLEPILQELQNIEAQMGDTSLYEESNKDQLQALMLKQGQLQVHADEIEEQWMLASEELEQLESEE